MAKEEKGGVGGLAEKPKEREPGAEKRGKME